MKSFDWLIKFSLNIYLTRATCYFEIHREEYKKN